jgi:hypothetical protein
VSAQWRTQVHVLSDQQVRQAFDIFALGASNPDQQAGYDASMKAQAVAGVVSGGYSLAKAGIAGLALSAPGSGQY